jgi:uncharacterized membrane protein YccC
MTELIQVSVTAGATLSKGFNRGLGTLTAGALALAVAELSKKLGKLEEVILIMSTFIVGKRWGMLKVFHLPVYFLTCELILFT